MFNRFFRFALMALLIITGNILSGPVMAEPAIDVSSVRLGLHEDKTRFVMEMSAEPKYDVFLLADPYRIVIDLPELDWRADDSGGRQKGIVQNYRFGLFKKDTSRVVLDVGGPVTILRTVILPPSSGKPYRFFIDIQKTDEVSFQRELAERRSNLSERSIALVAPEPPAPSRKYTIVIDPGHGGIDPGAIGKSGVYEKKITLAVSKRIHEILSKNSKYNPILTRDDDTFLSLRERVTFGRQAKADLFISIHADSIGRANFRGAAVYTLSENASDDEAAELAKSENKSDLIAGVDLSVQDDTVQGILIDLAQRETMNESAVFRVLKAPDVPSVLVELGYLSNREDEKILKSNTGQQRLAQAIANAVDKYFETIDP